MVYGSIICLGDSLTAGARCDFWRGYPVELELLLWKTFKQNWNCINEGVNGETSIDIYKRAYKVLRSYPEATEMVLLCGTNDAKIQVQTPPERYAEQVNAILRCAKRWEKVSYLCTIPALKGFGAPDFMRPDLIDDYNEELVKISGDWGRIVELVDMARIPEDCYADGVHLNNLGYKTMAERILLAMMKRRKYE